MLNNEIPGYSLDADHRKHRTCAFCQKPSSASSSLHLNSAPLITAKEPNINHSCLLNPGQSSGPDGASIDLESCTMTRQAVCQSHRLKMLSRLCETATHRDEIQTA